MKKRRPRKAPNAWQSSAQWRSIGSAAIREWNAKRARMPKCGAARKSDGKPCQQTPMANGRCYLHSGRVPRGDRWHVPQFPNADAPDFERKLQRKLADRERAAKRLAARLAAMTPDELARYRAWHVARRPGAAAARQRAKAEREANAEFRKLASRPRSTIQGSEAAELEAAISELKTELARRQPTQPDPIGAFA
ncbi:hypothetical protein N7E70_007155 [Aminobacter sp. NyZ550]|uniref:hypothetical protein n=1 Tax=Aminobacter sp. NyZ550 TaxID=2979870 RepID=UPI0021D5F0C2|nr:hypothetical protein [Aminobacter sp. NyZ550]WAX96632.1 hypothetical protein N7E70_007155 [Aminobacter sp. NyZ550]